MIIVQATKNKKMMCCKNESMKPSNAGLLLTELVFNSHWWLSVIPGMFLVRVEVEAMFLGRSMFIPLSVSSTGHSAVPTVAGAHWYAATVRNLSRN